MKKLNLLYVVSIIVIFFSSCASIFIPRYQNITISTNNPDATAYINNEEVGKGSTISIRVRKSGTKQVIIHDPEYKDTYYALTAQKRPLAYWLLQLTNIGFFHIGFLMDPASDNTIKYYPNNEMPCQYKYENRSDDNKYIQLDGIKFNFQNIDEDYKTYRLYRKPDIMTEIKRIENKTDEKNEIIKENNKKTLIENDDKKKEMDYILSENIFKTIKKTGYVDTLNTVFPDNNNILLLEGKINKVKVFFIRPYFGYKRQPTFAREDVVNYYNYAKAKVTMMWVVKNTYNEILDSISSTEFSGDFTYFGNKKNPNTAISDAIELSFLNLHKNEKFKKYLKQEIEVENNEPVLKITKPTALVTEVSDASFASVIIKNKEKHGSGFAITNDGYIITAYHVISNNLNDNLNEIKVILSDGEELKAKIIRYNSFRDIALLKVDKKFEKAFKISDSISYKLLQEVFTIGAPKSIVLGQSISKGIISNERNTNNNYLLQLNMSVNFGNSGGPLFDSTGTLHGIIVSKLTGINTEGIGFAIPGHKLNEYLNISYQ